LLRDRTCHSTRRDRPASAGRKAVLADLRREGLVREAFTPAGGHGAISILQAPSLDEVRTQMSRLPFVAHELMTFDYTEITEL
jgi:muconolactone delta-isomerase